MNSRNTRQKLQEFFTLKVKEYLKQPSTSVTLAFLESKKAD